MKNINQLFIMSVIAGLSISANSAYAGDAAAGEKVFKKFCAVCHTVEAGKNRVGPSLAGVIGRQAGTVAGYNYSPAMKASGITWNEETLKQFISNGRSMIPGNKEAFAGIKNPTEIDDVIAFLKSH